MSRFTVLSAVLSVTWITSNHPTRPSVFYAVTRPEPMKIHFGRGPSAEQLRAQRFDVHILVNTHEHNTQCIRPFRIKRTFRRVLLESFFSRLSRKDAGKSREWERWYTVTITLNKKFHLLSSLSKLRYNKSNKKLGIYTNNGLQNYFVKKIDRYNYRRSHVSSQFFHGMKNSKVSANIPIQADLEFQNSRKHFLQLPRIKVRKNYQAKWEFSNRSKNFIVAVCTPGTNRRCGWREIHARKKKKSNVSWMVAFDVFASSTSRRRKYFVSS